MYINDQMSGLTARYIPPQASFACSDCSFIIMCVWDGSLVRHSLLVRSLLFILELHSDTLPGQPRRRQQKHHDFKQCGNFAGRPTSERESKLLSWMMDGREGLSSKEVMSLRYGAKRRYSYKNARFSTTPPLHSPSVHMRDI